MISLRGGVGQEMHQRVEAVEAVEDCSFAHNTPTVVDEDKILYALR
jgi:hypothetical protein